MKSLIDQQNYLGIMKILKKKEIDDKNVSKSNQSLFLRDMVPGKFRN